MDSPDSVGNSAAKRTLARLGATKPPTGQFPVVYDKRVSASLVGTMAGAINGAAVARGTSFLKDRMGEQVAAGIRRAGRSVVEVGGALRPVRCAHLSLSGARYLDVPRRSGDSTSGWRGRQRPCSSC